MSKILPKGHVSCLNTKFRYVPAANTDLAKTFARIRRRQAKPQPADEPGNVRALPLRKSG
jgi:hypothetical protein